MAEESRPQNFGCRNTGFRQFLDLLTAVPVKMINQLERLKTAWFRKSGPLMKGPWIQEWRGP
jgi:hypothetical protein